MTTNELIQLLQGLDPSGQKRVVYNDYDQGMMSVDDVRIGEQTPAPFRFVDRREYAKVVCLPAEIVIVLE